MVLEWTERHAYVLTELLFFIITILIIFSTVFIIFLILLFHFRRKRGYFYILRPLFENVFTSAIAFSRPRNNNIKTVFLGHIEREFQNYNLGRAARLWVHIYFTLLCCVAVLWFATIFSDAVLYRKTGTCLDMNVRDSSARCFLLSTADPPPGVMEIINEEEGEAVPCQRVQNYLLLMNSTYDLEVICYISHISPLPALGVAYGTMKTITFGIIAVLTVFLALSEKIRGCGVRWRKMSSLILIHVVQVVVSLAIIGVIVTVVSSIHSTDGRNTVFDFLRGERFYHSSIVTLGSLTILITFGLFPWWAFKPLTPNIGQPPTSNIQQPPTPEIQQPPTPEIQQQPTPEIQQQPTPEIQQSPTPEIQQPPTSNIQQPPTPEIQQPPTPDIQETPAVGGDNDEELKSKADPPNQVQREKDAELAEKIHHIILLHQFSIDYNIMENKSNTE